MGPKELKKSIKLGITLGDPGGISYEVVIKALNDKDIKSLCEFLLIGDFECFLFWQERLKIKLDFEDKINFLDLGILKKEDIKIGAVDAKQGYASYLYIEKAIDLLKEGVISGLVTAPISKEALVKAGYKLTGHTEILSLAFGKDAGMMFVVDKLKVLLLTTHLPLLEAINKVKKNLIVQKIKLIKESLSSLFSIQNPKIGVCGINPHAGEGGHLGEEEEKEIKPAIKEARDMGILVGGPLAADFAFYLAKNNKYDGILAMYHDQGLIAVKMFWERAVNLTVGLPIIRTSPVHGVAYDIADKNIANPSSMKEAIKLACKLGGTYPQACVRFTTSLLPNQL